MNSNRGFVSLIVLLAVGVPIGTWMAGGSTTSRAAAGGERKKESAAEHPKAKSPGKGAPEGAARPAAETDADGPAAALDGVMQRGESTAAAPHFIFATFPDPIESPTARWFDEYLAALRAAFESMGFSKYESWDPWFPADGKAVEGQPWRKYPGLALFQNGYGEQWAVFLVGETPTRGVHNEALKTALGYWNRPGSPDRQEGVIRILGPSNSGATRSLANTLKKWVEDLGEAGAVRQLRIVTGSATSTSNGEVFRTLERELAGEAVNRLARDSAPACCVPRVDFEAVVNDDDTLKRFVADYLGSELKIQQDEIALLTESSSTYGRGFADDSGPARRGPLVLRYPPYINSVRRDDGAPGAGAGLEPLDRDGEDNAAADLFSPHAALTQAMAGLSLSRVIRAISEEHIRAVEIAALDPEDAAFLATKVREAFPAVVVVVLSSDALYLRHKYELDGLLVASTYPLSLRSQRTTFAFTGLDARLSFPSEQAEGVFNATLVLTGQHDLLDYGPPLRIQSGGQQPALWMSVVSNHELWPVEVETRQDVARMCKLPDGNVHSEPATSGLLKAHPEAWRPSWAVGFVAFTLVFALLSWMCAVYYVRGRWLVPEPPPDCEPLIVRIIGRRRDNEVLRGLSLLSFLLVLAILWSFVVVVEWGGGRRPVGGMGAVGLTNVVRPASVLTLGVVLSLLVDACLVWVRALFEGLREMVRKRRAGQPQAAPEAAPARRASAIGRAVERWLTSGGHKQSQWRLQLSKNWSRVLVALGGGGAIVGLNWVLLSCWVDKCGFGSELVDRAVDGRCQRFILFFDRARFLGSGVSLLATTIVLALGYFVWYGAHLYKVWLTHSFEELRRQDVFPDDEDRSRGAVARELDAAFTRFKSVSPSGGLWCAMVGVFVIALERASTVPCFEKPLYRVLTALFFSVFITLLVFGAGRSVELWARLRQLLRHIATTRVFCEGEKTPAELLGYLAWPWDPQVAQAWRAAGLELSPEAGEAFSRIIGVDGKIATEEWNAYLRPPDVGPGRPLLRTLYLWSSITYLRMHLLGLLQATSVGLLVSLVVVSMYPFRGERFLLGLVIGLGTLTAIAVTTIFLQLGKDYVVSRLGGRSKEASWDPEFIRGIVLHTVLPLLGLLSVRFPGIGQTLGTVLKALSGIAGAE